MKNTTQTSKNAVSAVFSRFYGVCSGVAAGGQREVINCMTGEVYRCGQFLRTNGSYLFEVVADGLVMAIHNGRA